jgi:hypothetical protein
MTAAAKNGNFSSSEFQIVPVTNRRIPIIQIRLFGSEKV